MDDALLADLLTEPYYSAPAPKSTGKELFNDAYLRAAIAGRDIAPNDLIATVTELTVRIVADELRRSGATFVAVSGGGAENPTMLAGLRAALPGAEVVRTDDLGIPADAKEAIAFALIGWLTMHGRSGAVPSSTGARGNRILGTIAPGRGPLRLPEPLPAAPAELRVTTATDDAGTVLRTATDADLGGIVKLFLDCWRISYAPVLPAALVAKMDEARAEEIWSRGLAESTTETLVAERQGEIVGVTRFGPPDPEHGDIRSSTSRRRCRAAGSGVRSSVPRPAS